MTYVPTERTNITWEARNRAWRLYTSATRDRASDFPVNFRMLTLDDLPDTPSGKSVLSWAKRWGEYPTSGLPLDGDAPRGKGLWLYGEPGLGKTRMASIAAQHVSDLGWSTKFISAVNLTELNKQSFNDDEERTYTDAAGACEHWDGWRMLVLDDVGKEHRTSTGYAENLLDRVFRNRFTSGAPTIVTSNLDIADIARIYSDSLHSYIHEAFWLVRVTGKDHRRGR